MSKRIPNVDDVERSRMSFSVSDDTNSTQIVSSGNHAEVSSFEFDEVKDLTLSDVPPDGIIHLNEWIRIPDSSSIMSDQEGNTFRSSGYFFHSEQLVRSFLRRDFVENEPSFDVVQESEMIASLFDFNDV